MNKYVNANAVFCKFGRNYMQWKNDLPIRPSELGVLNVIVKENVPLIPLKIAEHLDVSKSMVTAHIHMLEKNGYVFREYILSDKRSFYVIPTEKAKLLVSETDARLNAMLKKFESGLGEEKFAKLVALLEETQNILGE